VERHASSKHRRWIALAVVAGLAGFPGCGGDATPTVPGSDGEIAVPGPDVSGMEPQVASLIGQVRDAVLADPGSADAWGELGAIYDAHLITDPAEICYLRAREMAPGDFRWVYLLAIVREINGADADEAVALFEDAAGLRPYYVPIYVRLGDAFLRRGMHAEARAALERAVSLAPNNAMAHRRLGQVMLAMEDAMAAGPHLERAVELEPRDLTAYSALAQAYMRLGLTENAEVVMDRAEGLEPVNVLDDPVYGEQVFMRNMTSGRAFERAMEAIRVGAHERAVDHLLVVLSARPDHASAHYWAGTSCRRLGRSEQAARHLSQAVRIAPNMVKARMELAAVLLAREGAEPDVLREAEEHCKASLRLTPDDPEVHRCLEMVDEKMRMAAGDP